MRTPISVWTNDGVIIKLAYSQTEFLAVTRSIRGNDYLIVHRPTSMGIVFVKKLSDARAIMRALSGIDWNFGARWGDSFKRTSSKTLSARRRNSRWLLAKEQTREILKRFKGRYETFEAIDEQRGK